MGGAIVAMSKKPTIAWLESMPQLTNLRLKGTSHRSHFQYFAATASTYRHLRAMVGKSDRANPQLRSFPRFGKQHLVTCLRKHHQAPAYQRCHPGSLTRLSGQSVLG